MDNTDISIQEVRDPFYDSLWLSIQKPQNNSGEQRCSRTATPLYLTNLKDKLKTHMHNKHKLGSADISSCYFTGWQKLVQPPSPNSSTNTGLRRLAPKRANHKIRASLGARQCRARGGESAPAGAWLTTTRQTLISYFLSTLAPRPPAELSLGWACLMLVNLETTGDWEKGLLDRLDTGRQDARLDGWLTICRIHQHLDALN
eukprot:1158786-Pelagomonas_calceolata.AAC.14